MWKIFAGLCIRRPVIVSPILTPFQRKMRDFYADLEIQQSHLSAHEVRHRDDLERMAQSSRSQQSGGKRSPSNSPRQHQSNESVASLLTAKDMELSWESGEKEFWNEIGKLGIQPRGENDELEGRGKTSPTNTAWRHLDRNLVLLTRQRLGSTFDWGLPAAEELANSLLPSESHWKIVGNAPVAVHKYAYRMPNGDKQHVQMYFLNAYVDKLWRGENVMVEKSSDDGKNQANFAWSTLEEMNSFLSDKELLKRLHTFIVDY
ncbi:unnamed protein product [Rodentolepis nana]|uniref:MRP-L46 domain-containing protein n=1 Tax=Rodentolepis nana TaxID=102285 RepID=A0A0R3TLG5_RODNA|nr:unnamed protein product [Rodentolepis nana]